MTLPRSDTPTTASVVAAPAPHTSFPARVAGVLAAAVLLLVIWRLQSVLMLLFGAIILAVALQAGAQKLHRHLHLPRRVAVVMTVVLVFGMLGLGGWVAGGRLADELVHLKERLPDAVRGLQDWLGGLPLGERLLEVWHGFSDGGIPWARLLGMAGFTFGVVGNAVLMAIIAVYLTLDPPLYRDGFVRLFPVARRAQMRDALEAAGDGLARWLLGQGISMLFVGTATWIGLALLGVPLAFALGAIAALLGFIPYFGPIASGVLAALLAFTDSPQQALNVALLAFAIQQVEGNLLMPFVQRWAVELPPVLGLTSVLVFGLLFGLMGVIFATPLMVVLMILVQRLYVEGLLEGPQRAKPDRDAAQAVAPRP
jgi:predicted PurR-regulated permease PerM